jgi:hypothetical protein
MSFRLGKGWVNARYETESFVELGLERNTALGIFFVAPEQVYDSQSLSSAKTMPVPEDIGTWLENHPYLQADAPTETYIGGIRGKQFNLQATPPENYPTEVCDGPCVPFVVDPFDGSPVRLFEGGYRVIVLSVQDQTVMIVIDLEEGTPAKAEEILKSIEWKGVTTSTSTAGPENVGASSQERHLIQTPNAPDLEAEAEGAAGDYYRAAGSEEWAYTYEYLDSETQSMFTEGEWINKNQWFADNYPVVYHIQSVEVNSASQEPVAEVTLRLTYEDDSTETRNTQFVLEDGVWKHRFMEEEITRFMPDASYEEFVKAKS